MYTTEIKKQISYLCVGLYPDSGINGGGSPVTGTKGNVLQGIKAFEAFK